VVVALLVLWPAQDARLDAGVWLAIVVPVTERDVLGNPAGALHAVNTRTGEDIVLGDPAWWVSMSWSPGGRYLFAVSVPPDADAGPPPRLWIFDVGRRKAVVSVDWTLLPTCACMPTNGSWSPDGRSVALLAQPYAAVLSREGTLIVRPSIAPRTNRSEIPAAWAPDSSRYAYGYGQQNFAIVTRDGQTTFDLDRDAWPAELGASGISWQLGRLSWRDSTTLVFDALTFPADASGAPSQTEQGPLRYVRATGHLATDGTSIAWEPVASIDAPSSGASEELRQQLGLPGHPMLTTAWSRDGELVGGTTVDRPDGVNASDPTPRDRWFVAIIDGQRFAYSLGRPADRDVVPWLLHWPWDMVRVK
jgi:hypothetical protein